MSHATLTLVHALSERFGIDARRLRDLALMALIVLGVAYVAPTVPYNYPTYFGAVLAFGVLLFMIENQERTLYLLLWFSTIYFILKATLLAWSGLAFLFKEGFLALLVGFWLFHLLIRDEKIRSTPLNRPVFALIAWLAIEVFNPNAVNFLTAIDDFRFWIGPLLVFLLTVHLVHGKERVERALRFVFIYALLESVYGIAQQWMPGDLLVKLGADPNSYFYFIQGATRSFSTMGTANFALFASMFPAIGFFYMSQQKNPLHRMFFLASGFVFVAGVLFTLVRAGWISVGISVVAYALVTRRVQVLGVILTVALLVSVFSSGFMRYKLESMKNYDEDVSIQTRLQIVEILWKGVAFRVFGYGMGTFAKNRFGYSVGGQQGIGTATENWYLATSLELGWIGVLLVGWIWYQAYRFGWRGYKGGFKTRRYRELSISLLTGMFAIDIARLGGPAGYYPPDSWHYWFFVGLLMALPSADDGLAAEAREETVAVPAPRPAPGAPVRRPVTGAAAG